MPQWSSACTFGDEGDVPFVLYNDMERMATHMLEDHGPDVAMAAGELFAHVGQFDKYFRQAMFDPENRYLRGHRRTSRPRNPAGVRGHVVRAGDGHRPAVLPGDMARTLQGSMAAMAVDGFDGGPWTPGSGRHWSTTTCCAARRDDRPHRDAARRHRQPQQGTAAAGRVDGSGRPAGDTSQIDCGGIQQRKPEGHRSDVARRIYGHRRRGVLDADPYTTFLGLTGEQHFPTDFVRKLREINFDLGYIQAHMTIEGEPEWIERLQPFVSDNGKKVPTLAYLPSAEYVADGWDQYRAGRFPAENPPAYLYMPSYCDTTLAPAGITVPRSTRSTSRWAWTPTSTASKRSATPSPAWPRSSGSPPASESASANGSCSPTGTSAARSVRTKATSAHGTLSPVQIWNRRGVPGESQYSTPVDNLFLVGQGAHLDQGSRFTGLERRPGRGRTAQLPRRSVSTVHPVR